jgi:hypothetical protein
MKAKTQLRASIRKIVRNTQFKNQDKEKIIELIVLRAIELIASQERRARLSEERPLSKGRGRPNQSAHRTILTAAIIRAWRVGQDEKPVVNKRLPGATPSPFVVFTTNIYLLLYIFNVIDNLDHYRGLGNRLEKIDFVHIV